MLSIIKTILRNPFYTGTAYAIQYFVVYAVLPLLGFALIENFGLWIDTVRPEIIIAFGTTLAILIFIQKALRRKYYRLSGVSGILRYFVSLMWVWVIAQMLSSIWVYGSIWAALQNSYTWLTIDYSFVIWLVLLVFIIRFVRYGYQIIFAKDLQGEKGVEKIEEEIVEELED